MNNKIFSILIIISLFFVSCGLRTDEIYVKCANIDPVKECNCIKNIYDNDHVQNHLFIKDMLISCLLKIQQTNNQKK